MGGMGFGQGYFAQYASGGTPPVEFDLDSVIVATLVSNNALHAVASDNPALTVVSTNPALTVEYSG